MTTLAELLARYPSPAPEAEVGGTPFAHDERNPIARWLMPQRAQTLETHDASMWRQKMGIPSESDEYWATAEGSPWKRTAGQNALMKVNEALNTPTGIVLSNFLGPAVGRIPKPGMTRAYHGTNENFTTFDPAMMGSRGKTDEGSFAFSRSPELASAYADGEFRVPPETQRRLYAEHTTPDGKLRLADYNRAMELAAQQTKAGRVMPVDIDETGFSRVNMAGYDWARDEGARLAGEIAKAKAGGARGLVAENMVDGTGIRDTQVHTWTPGTVYSSTTGERLFSGLPAIAAGGAAFVSGATNDDPMAAASAGRVPKGGTSKGIRAYHGSPHDFDRFDMSKIGTGEGAQAYGHGLYFAENEGVAKSYKQQLADVKINGKAPDYDNPTHWMAISFDEAKGNPSAAIQELREWWKISSILDRKAIDKAIASIENGSVPALPKVDQSGRIYEVNINADPEKFIDYDKPFAQQTPEVREAVSKALFQHANKQGDIDWHIDGWMAGEGRDMQSPLQLMQYRSADPTAASKALAEAGIPGIRYKDAGSRGADGPGTSNYVVFDDKLIEILRKYGIAGLMAGGASASSILDRYTSAPQAE